MSSTKTSSDFGELKRPTTRVHAPPGGGSSWSIGAPTEPVKETIPRSPSKKKIVDSPSKMHQSSSVNPLNIQREEELEITPQIQNVVLDSLKENVKQYAKLLRIAILHSSQAEDVVKVFAQNCSSYLYETGVLNQNLKTLKVPNLTDLPYAAAKLLRQKQYHAVICFGLLEKNDYLFNSLSSSLMQAFMKIGVETQKPVVSGIHLSDTITTAKSKALSGWGKQMGEDCLNLIFLGGFQPVSNIVESVVIQNQFPAKVRPSKLVGNALKDNLLNAPATVQNLMTQLRSSLLQQGARGIVGLSRKFRIIDDNGNRSLCIDEFKKAIAEHSMGWNEQEVLQVFNYFDEDNSGSIDFDEFLVAIRGELNTRREQLVLTAFEVLDADKNGVIELDDIVQKYNADKHPDVIAKRKTKNEVFREFLDTFDGGEKDGKVYPYEFIRYYANVSASIDDDDYFELMIRNAWHISGGEGWCANTTCRRVLVTHPDGRQTVEEIKDDIGIEANEISKMEENLKSQGIQASNIELTGTVDTTTPPPAPVVHSRSKPRGAGESSIVFG